MLYVGKDAEEITGRFLIGNLVSDQLFDAIASKRFDGKEQQPEANAANVPTQRFYVQYNIDTDHEGHSKLKLNMPTTKDIHPLPHRRSSWHESPDPNRINPKTGKCRFPRYTDRSHVHGPERSFDVRSQPQEEYLLHSTRWCKIELVKKVSITHDTAIFTFRPPRQHPMFSKIGLSVGQHLLLGANIGEE